jgi:hypothetical protein
MAVCLLQGGNPQALSEGEDYHAKDHYIVYHPVRESRALCGDNRSAAR